jgi:hypothetical protein
MRFTRILPVCALLVTVHFLLADGPGDNVPDKVRRIPPAGIVVPDADKSELQAGIDTLGKEIEALRSQLKGKAAMLELLPDLQIYHNAVRYAVEDNQFYNAKEIGTAKNLLKQGMDEWHVDKR